MECVSARIGFGGAGVLCFGGVVYLATAGVVAAFVVAVRNLAGDQFSGARR